MEALIIHNPEVPQSVKMAKLAFNSCKLIVDLQPVMTPGVRKSEAFAIAHNLGLKLGFDYIEQQRVRPMRDGQVGAFLAHRRAWLHAAECDKPIVVLEHDVTFTKRNTIPEFDSVLNLQRMVWDDPKWQWHAKMQQFTGMDNGNAKYNVMPGVCAYAITPQAAATLLDACTRGMIPVDLFMNKTVVKIDDHPHIKDLVYVKNDFSTVRPGSVEF